MDGAEAVNANHILSVLGLGLIALAIYLDPYALDTGLTVGAFILIVKMVLG